MSAYPLEAQRRRLEDFERSLRVATASMREQERFLSRPKKGGARGGGFAEDGKAGVLGGGGRRGDNSLFVNVDGELTIHTTRDAELVTRKLIDRAHEQICSSREQMEAGSKLTKELKVLAGDGQVDAAIQTFYERLTALQSAFEGATSEEHVLTSTQIDRQVAMEVLPEIDFTGEEAGGKYLDLHEAHNTFINLKGIDPKDYTYVHYLSSFYDFNSLPDFTRSRPAYKFYLQQLLTYLQDFCRRVFPLKFVSETLDDVEKKTLEAMQEKSQSVADWTKYDTPEALLSGETPDTLKEALKGLGLKCGGTPAQRAERLFGAVKNEGKTNHEAKGILNSAASIKRDVAILEAKIQHLSEELLSDIVQNTRMNVEKKLALSYEELEAERLAEEDPQAAISEEGDSDSGEEKPIYNPKDVPLGWDGKPIPYWLYKLHGLNHEFKCEICGDVTYKGPRNFERHFSEARHTHNLKMLGIQYSRHYYMVTKIADALRLKEKLEKEKSSEQFHAEDEEEFEDADGNVFNRKTYEDLRRQGLL